MSIAKNLDERVDERGLRWGAEGLRAKAEAVVKGLAALGTKDPLVALTLLQATVGNSGESKYLQSPSAKFVRDAIRNASELLGESDLPGWVSIISLESLLSVTGKNHHLRKLSGAAGVSIRWTWEAPKVTLGSDIPWGDISPLVEPVPEPIKTAAAKIHGRLGAVEAARVAFATGWSQPTHLLWWGQAEWSERAAMAWRDIPQEHLATLLASEFVDIAPVADVAVNFFLKTLRVQGVELAETQSLHNWVARSRAAVTWGALRGHRGTAVIPAALAKHLSNEPTGLPICAGLTGTMPPEEPSLTALSYYRRLAEEFLIVRNVFGS